jgi:hypothetical protein
MALQIIHYDTHKGITTPNKDLQHGLTPTTQEQNALKQRILQQLEQTKENKAPQDQNDDDDYNEERIFYSSTEKMVIPPKAQRRKGWKHRAHLRNKKIQARIVYEKKIWYAQQALQYLRNVYGIWHSKLNKYYGPITTAQPQHDYIVYQQKFMVANIDYPLQLFARCYAWYLKHRKSLEALPQERNETVVVEEPKLSG